MSIYEYDQEEHIRLEREDAYEDGRQDGRQEGRQEGIKLTKKVYQLQREGISNDDIAKECNIPFFQVEEILE